MIRYCVIEFRQGSRGIKVEGVGACVGRHVTGEHRVPI